MKAEEVSLKDSPKAMAMTISLSDAGKRFNRDWIFRHLSYEFSPSKSYAITGPNGSGKSTLLQVLAGSMQLNEGNLKYQTQNSTNGSTENMFQFISLAAPYLEVVEEMTLNEFFDFHKSFKSFLQGTTTENIITTLGLESSAEKQIRYYSSGMKQRVKLGQCIFSDTPVVLLDEPCTNLDAPGIALYHELIKKYCANRLVIVSSNDEVEYNFCEEKISMSDYKK